MNKLFTIFLITILAGTLVYLLQYPISIFADNNTCYQTNDCKTEQQWKDGWYAANPPPPCDQHKETRTECGGRNGQQVCAQDYMTGCGDPDSDVGGPYNCRYERGQCNYWGVCRPRYCDSTVVCDPQCFEDNTNTKGGTCNKPYNGHQTNCIYTKHSSGKACVPKDAPNQRCWTDACHYPLWKCDSVANNCVYTKANTEFDNNFHTNR